MRIGSRNVSYDCCTKESSYNTFLTRNSVSRNVCCDCCTKESSYKVLLIESGRCCPTWYYYWQQSMPPKEQWRLSLCTVDVCLHRRTMISILVMYVLTVDVCLHRRTTINILVMSVLKFNVCLRGRVWDYDSMSVSMRGTMFNVL